MKEWILIVVPVSPITVVSVVFSVPSFPANQTQDGARFLRLENLGFCV